MHTALKGPAPGLCSCKGLEWTWWIYSFLWRGWFPQSKWAVSLMKSLKTGVRWMFFRTFTRPGWRFCRLVEMWFDDVWCWFLQNQDGWQSIGVLWSYWSYCDVWQDERRQNNNQNYIHWTDILGTFWNLEDFCHMSSFDKASFCPNSPFSLYIVFEPLLGQVYCVHRTLLIPAFMTSGLLIHPPYGPATWACYVPRTARKVLDRLNPTVSRNWNRFEMLKRFV